MRSEVQLLPDPPVSSEGRVVHEVQADGAIAQLGERRVCNAKVVGSIPTGSTNYSITACHESCISKRLLHDSWHASRGACVCSLKIRQFVLMSDSKAQAFELGVAFENQLIVIFLK